jgi:hypothetical protein
MHCLLSTTTMKNYTSIFTSILIIAGLFLLQQSSLQAATIILNPTADAMVNAFASRAGNNYGGAGAFAVSASNLANGEYRAWLQFDLSTAKTLFDNQYGANNWNLQSATLLLTAANPGNPIFNSPSAAGSLSISWIQNNTWIEGAGTPNGAGATGITWNNAASFQSGSDQQLGNYSFTGATSGNFIYNLPTSSGILGNLQNGTLMSLLMAPSAGDNTVAAVFNSRTFTTTASRPMLTLSAEPVPEPSTLFLIICIIGFAVWHINP